MVQADAPQLLRLFDVFAAEALFGRAWLAPHLARLPAGARVLEVGAGLMLLSSQLAREGYAVVALEPVGSGFSDFRALQTLVREHASRQGVALRVLEVPVEDLQESNQYDFAFSINVMEHLKDVERAVTNVTRALRSGASYAFTCPNYRFPYEPHFGLPIVGSKRLTGWLFSRQIRSSTRVLDSAGLWDSLNWITVGMVDRACRRLPGVEWRYDRSSLPRTLERATRDAEFASRRAGWMLALARILVATRLHRVLAVMPASLQPMIDCTIVRKAA